jgi:hypothetical protein
MAAPDASAVAALLREFGQRSALRGGNPFRSTAYARAADNLLALSLPIGQIIAQDAKYPASTTRSRTSSKSFTQPERTPRSKKCGRKSRQAFSKC